MCSRGERSAEDARGNQACAQEESDLQTMQEVNQACAQEESDLQRMQEVTKRVLKRRAICRRCKR